MVCGYRVSSQALSQMMRHTFRQAARVHKDQCGAMLPCQFCDAVVDFAPHLVGDNWSELAARDFDRQVQLASVVYLHHCGVGTIGTGQEARNNFDGLLRSRKTDPHRAPIGQIFQSLQGKRQVRAALVISDGVDFVHNNSLDIPQDFAALLRGQ